MFPTSIAHFVRQSNQRLSASPWARSWRKIAISPTTPKLVYSPVRLSLRLLLGVVFFVGMLRDFLAFVGDLYV